MKNNPPIVIVAYNRLNSLKRLLESLKKAEYPAQKSIRLIISIDNGHSNEEVLNLAEDFLWSFGQKIIINQAKNLGLRKHILKCASLSTKYDSVILLEDDLFVGPQFYNYACQALEFSESQKNIGGISLYNHQFNVNAKVNFSPFEDGFDNWYFKFASSWGQAWTKAQWNNFLDWYDLQTELKASPEVPKNVTAWSDKSWLKYFIHYLTESNKYFLYPKISHTTNFSDAGTHIENNSTVFQVPLNYSKSKKYNFSKYSESNATYDAFFENEKLFYSLGLDSSQVCIDLYGTKLKRYFKQQYVLSSNIYNYKILKSYGLQLKPIENNIIQNIEGTSLFLYDTKVNEINRNKNKFYQHLIYNIKHITRKDAKKIYLIMFLERILTFFKKK